MMESRLKTAIVALILGLLIISNTPVSLAEKDYSKEPEIDGKSAIMMDATSGEILYSKNSNKAHDPASITKILTCLVVIEEMALDEKVTVTEDASPIGYNINTKKGEVFSVEQLLYAMMLPSANDAAKQLAIATAGDVDSFCKLMNKRAEKAGAKDTHFTNPNGLNLPGQEHHKTTAEDMALIIKEAIGNEKFREIISKAEYTIPQTNKSEERHLKSTNLLLYSKKSVEVSGEKIPLRYKWTVGGKTGTTSSAGNCFAAVSHKGNTELIAVNFDSGDKTRFTDVIRLFDYGFGKYRTRIVARPEDELDIIPIKEGATGKVNIGPASNLSYLQQKDAGGKPIKTETKITVKKSKKFLVAPVKRGQVIGTVCLEDSSGNVIMACDAVALDNVAKGGPLSKIGIPDDLLPLYGSAVVTIILIAAIIIILRRKCHSDRR